MSTHPNHRRGQTGAEIGLLALAFANFALFLWAAFRGLQTKSELHIEGVILGFMESIRLGRLYQADALTHAPFSLLSHTPLSYWAAYPMSRLAPHELWPLRLLTLLVSLALAALVFRRVQRLFRDPVAGLFASGVLCSIAPVFFWARLARCPDQLEACFTLLAIGLLYEQGRSDFASRRRSLQFGLLAFLAVWSKQTSLPILWGTALIYRARLKNLRNLHVEVLTFVALSAVAVALLQWQSHGGFLKNITVHLLLKKSHSFVVSILFYDLSLFWPLVGLVLLSPFARTPLHWIYFGVSLLAGVFSAAGDGSSSIHFLNAFVAVALLAGESLHRVRVRERWDAAAWKFSAGFIVALVLSLYHNKNLVPMKFDAEYQAVLQFARRWPGRVLSNDPYVSFNSDSPFLWDDVFTLRPYLADNPELNEILRRQDFQLVVSNQNEYFFPKSTRAFIADNFCRIRQASMYDVYLRKPHGEPCDCRLKNNFREWLKVAELLQPTAPNP